MLAFYRTMTSNKDVHASGTAQDGADLRRRNVPGGQNSALTSSEEEVDDKKSQKVRLNGWYYTEVVALTSFASAQIAVSLNFIYARRI